MYFIMLLMDMMSQKQLYTWIKFTILTIIFFGFFISASSIDDSSIILDERPVTSDIVSDQTQKAVTVRFFGDVMLGRHVETLMHSNGQEYPLDNWWLDVKSDASVINFESAMTKPHRQTRNFTFQFATNPTFISALDKLHVTHASLANNHALDFGQAGYNLTTVSLTENNITTFGHPTSIATSTSASFFRKNDITISLVGLHTLFKTPSHSDLSSLFTYVNEMSDVQVVFVHWGDEYSLVSNAEQQQLAEQLVDLGADVIIGHHPHVVQEIALIAGVPVFYSLGNFIFDQYFSPAVQDGLVVDMVIGESLAFNLHPVTSQNTPSQPRLLSNDEQMEFLQILADRSDKKLYDMILEGRIDLEKLAIAP